MQSIKNKNISSLRIFCVRTRKGDDMYIKNAFSRNAEDPVERTSGLYRVVKTHVKGTVSKELRPGVSERLNIRRNIPYKE